MDVSELTPEMHKFLSGTRLGHLTHGADPWPHVVPVWFEWTGTAVEFFTRRDRPKVGRLRADPIVSMVVSAEVGETADWIAVDGRAVMSDDAVELVGRLCSRYCDQATTAGRELHADIMSVADTAVKVTIVPERIRRFA